MQGVVIAGTHSGCGKTTVTLGIIAALHKKGLKVQPFKTGPDFIDTGLHKLITGRTSRNLDLWMCGSDYVTKCFHKNMADADIAVIEGVMGMYDGNICTADLATSLDLPVILVVDAYGMAESAGAIVKGFMKYDRKGMACHAPTFAGVIFNRVASQRHWDRLKDSVKDIPVLGYLPRDLDFNIPHRHLGLVVAEENPIDKNEIDKLADAILEHVDVDMIEARAGAPRPCVQQASPLIVQTALTKVAVAYDKAFCFYYEDNLDLLREAGAEIVQFSPLSDTDIPDGTDAIYIGGGYPELHAGPLSENKTMLESIKNFAASRNPVYAECGGFMYLTEGIYTFDNVLHSMAGIFPFKTRMLKGRSRLGYREAVLNQDSILGQKGAVVRGHEFHYSEIDRDTSSVKPSNPRTLKPLNLDFIYSVKDGSNNDLDNEGYMIHNTLGSYIHIHFGSNPEIAGHLIHYFKEHHGTDTVSRTR
jgi:cobyrinic acid a,c-diamide synthase